MPCLRPDKALQDAEAVLKRLIADQRACKSEIDSSFLPPRLGSPVLLMSQELLHNLQALFLHLLYCVYLKDFFFFQKIKGASSQSSENNSAN